MAYTRDFIDRVKNAYPSSARIHELAESGSEWLGRYLCEKAPKGIYYDEILAATSLKELKMKALHIKEKNELYRDFLNGTCYEKSDIDALIEHATIVSEQSEKTIIDFEKEGKEF